MRALAHARAATVILVELMLVSLVLASPGLGHSTASHSASVSPATTSPVHRTFTLRGSQGQNWNLTSPGPFMSVISGDTVTLLLISADTACHTWFLDFNNNNIVDSNELPTYSGVFCSTTSYFNFTWVPTIGTNIPSAGNWTYKCSLHPTFMFGTFRVSPAQVTASVAATSTLDSSRVSTTGSLVIDMRSLTVSGSLTVTAVDSTTGATTFTKTYTIPNIPMTQSPGSNTLHTTFLVNVAVAPYALSVDSLVQLNGLTASTQSTLTRQLDINGDGGVDFADFSVAAFAYGSLLGGPNFNPKADFDADGSISFTDISLAAFYYLSPAFF